jgi:hypothetical protein
MTQTVRAPLNCKNRANPSAHKHKHRRGSAHLPIPLTWERWEKDSVLQQGAKRAIFRFVLHAQNSVLHTQSAVLHAQNLVLHTQIGLPRGVWGYVQNETELNDTLPFETVRCQDGNSL